MPKQPTEAISSDPSSSSGKADPAQAVRQVAETTLSQARQAVDQYMREATRLYGAMEASTEASQSPSGNSEGAGLVMSNGSRGGLSVPVAHLKSGRRSALYGT